MLRVSEKDDFATKEGRFQMGDPLLGKKSTRVSVSWLNAVQDEITNVIEKSGRTLTSEPQLYEALVDLYRFGTEKITLPLLNNVQTETDLGYRFESTQYSAVYFNALSLRHTTIADPAFCSSHVAVFNIYTSSWSLLTQAETALFTLSAKEEGGEEKKIIINPGPHLLTIKPSGELTYRTSPLPGENYEGSIHLSHFRCLRI
jgi:hypothetical protein